MAIIQCPYCQGKMRFPDDSEPKKVKCPTCAESFMGSVEKKETPPASAPVDDDRPKRSSTRSDDDDRPRSRRDDDYEEVEDRKRSRRDDDDDRGRSRRDDNDRGRSRRDDDDDRGRSRRDDDNRGRSRRDDDDDRPRSRRDDDDDDDRRRSRRDDDDRRSRRRDDDDYDEGRPRVGKESLAQYGNARLGMTLMSIGFWCNAGAHGTFLLVMLLAYLTKSLSVLDFVVVSGLCGGAHWILSTIGIGFLAAGPSKGNLFGLKLSLVIVAGIHLLLLIAFIAVAGSQLSRLGAMTGAGNGLFILLITSLFFTLLMLVGGTFTPALVFIVGLVELIRLTLTYLTWKELAKVSKDSDGVSKSGLLMLFYPIMVVGTILLMLLLKVIFKEAGGSDMGTVIGILAFLVIGTFTAMYVFSAIIATSVRDGIRRVKSK